MSCFLKTTAKKLGNQYIVGLPTYKFGGPVSPGLYGCCAYGEHVSTFTSHTRSLLYVTPKLHVLIDGQKCQLELRLKNLRHSLS